MPVLFILLAVALTINAIPTNNDGARQKRELNKIFVVNFPPSLIENTASLFISESNESDNSDSDSSSSDSTIRSTPKPSSHSNSKSITQKSENSTNSLPVAAGGAKLVEVSTGSGRESSVRQKRNVPGFINIFNNGIHDGDEVVNRAFNEFANFDQSGEKNFVGWVNHASQNIENRFPVDSPPAGSTPPASTANLAVNKNQSKLGVK